MGPRRSRAWCLSLRRPRASRREPPLPRTRGRSGSGLAKLWQTGLSAPTCGAWSAPRLPGRAWQRRSGLWGQCRGPAS
eukprot:6657474-Alexandrium_andersonii.AAC.1